MTEKWCEIQGKLDLVRVSGKFGLLARDSTVPESLAQGLMTKTTTFLYVSLPSLHDSHLKLLIFKFYGGLEHKTTTLFFFF